MDFGWLLRVNVDSSLVTNAQLCSDADNAGGYACMAAGLIWKISLFLLILLCTLSSLKIEFKKEHIFNLVQFPNIFII